MADTRSLNEVIFTAHFLAPEPLTVLDLADWYNGVAKRYPIFQQQQPWSPFVWHDFETAVPGPPVVPQFFGGPGFIPRLLGYSEDQRWAVNCQYDRIAISWRRLEPTGEPTPYPGFESVLEEVLKFLEGFQAWWLGRFGASVIFQICELNYFNAFPFKSGQRQLRVSEVFRAWIFRPGKKIANLNVSWMMPPEPSEHARVQCLAAMGATADCPSAAIFNFAGSIKMGDRGSPDKLRPAYDALHRAVTDAYLSTINVETIGAQE